MQVFSRNADIELAPLQGKAILFNAQQNKFCVLNKTSAFIWTQLETPASAEDLARGIVDRFDGVSNDDALTDVRQALDEFVSLDLARAA